MVHSPRTFVIGDVHGESGHLDQLWSRLPVLTAADTLVFLGDYLNRGPDSAGVVRRLREWQRQGPARVVCLRGNHEEAWLRIRREGWDGFALAPDHGCLATYRSFTGGPVPAPDETPRMVELGPLTSGSFFPEEVVAWLESLPYWYENEHGIYVHAGLPRAEVGFAHPAQVAAPSVLVWLRTDEFVRNYRGKDVFFGHTPTRFLPQELSLHTPDDPHDVFMTEDCHGLDTGCGLGGYLTALELPAKRVYESRPRAPS